MKDANERIKEAFPDMVPSGGHDYVDEVMGLLRVTRSQRDDMERLWVETSRHLAVLQKKIESSLEYEKVKLQLDNLPATWYPALLIAIVHAAYRKDVFQHGGASRLIAKLEKTSDSPEAPTLQNWGVWDIEKDCWFLSKKGEPVFGPQKSAMNMARDWITEYSREIVHLEVRPYPAPAVPVVTIAEDAGTKPRRIAGGADVS